jgi:hypothetical protein
MNSIFIIEPYKVGTTWAFDDLERGLVKEPFVGGMGPVIKKILIDKYGESKDRFTLFFSDIEFPDFDFFLEKGIDLNNGSFYSIDNLNLKGWLCPALRKYYTLDLPQKIYFKIEVE